MPDLAEFQRVFAQAILDDEQPVPSLRSHAFAVYRNTAARGTIEALRATYATVNELLGDDGFTHAALEFRAETPPAGPVLSDYGRSFPEFLARQSWTSELPYLADVAKLDWLWLESFLAGEADATPRSYGVQSQLVLHPAARFAWLATPALTIWNAHRQPGGFDELEPEWREEGALFTRPGLTVRAEAIDPACHRLLLSCVTPARIDECVAAVAEDFPQSDVPSLLQRCVSSGALIIL